MLLSYITPPVLLMRFIDMQLLFKSDSNGQFTGDLHVFLRTSCA